MCLLNDVAVTNPVKMGAELASPQCLFKSIARRHHSVPLSKAHGLSGRADSVSIKSSPEPPTPCSVGYLSLLYPKCGKYHSKM